MKNLYYLSFCLLILSFYSCKKDSKETQSDCQTNNYGTLKVTYSSSSVKHSILVTFNTGSFREKISAIGTTSDTVHLTPGSYPISIASLNSSNEALDQQTFQSQNISQCTDTNLSVAF